jgi:hypothetical protein
MALADKFKPWYPIQMVCGNCGKTSEIRIKKGVTVPQAMSNKEITCTNCKCLIDTGEYTTQWIN